jgi:hypothetical protein
MEQGETPKGPRTVTEVRRQREAEALRANLRKRKDQQRARESPPPADTKQASADKDPGEA